jgi:hypothetical protein
VFSDDFFDKRSALLGRMQMADLGYKCLQYTQVATVFMAREAAEARGQHFFARVGTGQGKSVIIALLAAHYAKEKNRQVVIFSCYKHLAKRDYRRFKPVFDELEIESTFVDSEAGGFKDAMGSNAPRILYADMHTLFNEIQKRSISRMKGSVPEEEDETADHLLHDISEAVCILDEFDSLIMEHHIVTNTVFPMEDVVKVTRVTERDMGSGSRMMTSLRRCSKEHISWPWFYFRQLRKHELVQAADNYLDEIEGTDRPGSDGINELGVHVSYIGGDRYELKKGNLYGKPIPLNSLTYLQSFRNIVGLSGSIEPEQIQRFSKLFGHKPSTPTVTFVHVPNFYGTAGANRAAITVQEDISTTGAWRAAVEKDVELALGKGQPVLVFSDPRKAAEFQEMKRTIEAVARRKSVKFLLIEKESEVNDKNLGLAATPGYITLATHVAGRGADFAVKPEVSILGGLHVCITFVPKTKAGDRDQRLLTQMIGRTARMQSKGTYSTLAINAASLPEESNDAMTVDVFDQRMHQLFCDIYQAVHTLPAAYRAVDTYQRLAVLSWLLPKLKHVPKRIQFVNGTDTGQPQCRRSREQQTVYVLRRFLRVQGRGFEVLRKQGLLPARR